MRTRTLVACAAAGALALPALAQAQPSKFTLTTQVPANSATSLTVGTVPKGEFAFNVRVASDGDKNFVLTQKRSGGSAFTVLRAPGPMVEDACQGAAGSLICSGITTPATPAGRAWTFRFANRSDRPMSLTLKISWRKVASAG
ncbi:MAG: hypothetical protein AB7V42_10370 [Thermoleophilia bacterium]